MEIAPKAPAHSAKTFLAPPSQSEPAPHPLISRRRGSQHHTGRLAQSRAPSCDAHAAGPRRPASVARTLRNAVRALPISRAPRGFFILFIQNVVLARFRLARLQAGGLGVCCLGRMGGRKRWMGDMALHYLLRGSGSRGKEWCLTDIAWLVDVWRRYVHIRIRYFLKVNSPYGGIETFKPDRDRLAWWEISRDGIGLAWQGGKTETENPLFQSHVTRRRIMGY